MVASIARFGLEAAEKGAEKPVAEHTKAVPAGQNAGHSPENSKQEVHSSPDQKTAKPASQAETVASTTDSLDNPVAFFRQLNSGDPSRLAELEVLRTNKAALSKGLGRGSSTSVWDAVSRETLESGTIVEQAPKQEERASHDASPADPALQEASESIGTNYFKGQPKKSGKDTMGRAYYQERLEEARGLRKQGRPDFAAKVLAELLAIPTLPEEIQRTVLIQLAIAADDAKQYVKAQQIYDHFRKKFPDDPSVAEVLLRQGLIYRKMGANDMALIKLYAVNMTALNYKTDHLDYYKRLVWIAKMEIANTRYLRQEWEEAIKLYKTLMKEEADVGGDKALILFMTIRSHENLGQYGELVGKANEFVVRFKDDHRLPEVRFLLATALKKTMRVRDSIAEVYRLLESQESNQQSNPANWHYWQQKTGNEIASQLFNEGDYANALELYLSLLQLNSTADWQVPILYQIGLIYERMRAPMKAVDTYSKIVGMEKEIMAEGKTITREVLDMARWRKSYFAWDAEADRVRQELIDLKPRSSTDTANP